MAMSIWLALEFMSTGPSTELFIYTPHYNGFAAFGACEVVSIIYKVYSFHL